MVPDSLQNLISDLEGKGIVCPLPIPWSKLFDVIKTAKQLKVYSLEKPSPRLLNPLILAGWGASDKAKWERFTYHLKEADELGILHLVEEFLAKLEPREFLVSSTELSDVSVWDVQKELLDKVEKEQVKALPSIQRALDLNVPKKYHYDPDRLYSLFSEHGFFGGDEPSVSDAKNLATVDALRDANKIYKKQAKMAEGDRKLRDFCHAVLELKIRLEN